MSFILIDQLTQSFPTYLPQFSIQEHKSPAIHGELNSILGHNNLTNQCETHQISNELTQSVYLSKHGHSFLSTTMAH